MGWGIVDNLEGCPPDTICIETEIPSRLDAIGPCERDSRGIENSTNLRALLIVPANAMASGDEFPSDSHGRSGNDIFPHLNLTDVVVYCHGFPDMSIHPSKPKFFSRMPRKLCEELFKKAVAAQDADQRKMGFLCFNFSGVPGSDNGLAFKWKTISQEVSDLKQVIQHIRQSVQAHDAVTDGHSHSLPRAHVVGLSTGAIVAALHSNLDEQLSSTSVIAGLLDLKAGTEFDFDASQRQDFETKGYCMKEFWIPEEKDGDEGGDGGQASKVYWELGKQYYDECVDGSLDIGHSVSNHYGVFVVIHGDDDKHVPVECGQNLFEATKSPKKILIIRKGNHFLSSSNHMKKAVSQIWDVVSTGGK